MTLSVLGLALAANAASVSEMQRARATRIRNSSARECNRARARSHLFFDARRLAGQVAQVVELGAAHVAATLDA